MKGFVVGAVVGAIITIAAGLALVTWWAYRWWNNS